MTYNCNAELFSSDSISLEALTYLEKTDPYNDKFEDQGYYSIYILENAKPSINNINNMLILSLVIHLIHRMLEKFKK